MKAIRLSRGLIVVIALVVSLGANVALFVGGVVYSGVDEFVDQVVGFTTAAAAQGLGRLESCCGNAASGDHRVESSFE